MYGQLTFLQLSPEFGGTRFGPFPGPEIRLGSDPAASDITLPEALGVLPQHVKILIQNDGSFIVAPTERTAAVHVFRGNSRPKHIATATALSANDSFALVTAEGPRFIILAEAPKVDKNGPKRPKKPDMVPTKEGLWAELKRVGFTLFFRNYIGNFVMRAWTMVKTGTIFTPRFIIGAIFLSTGWFAAIFAGVAALGGMFALSSKADQLEEVQGDLAECQTFDVDDADIFSLTQLVLGDDEWAQSLRNDDDFREAFISKAKAIDAAPDDYRVVYTARRSDFTRLRTAAEDERGLGPLFGSIFAYTAAVPGNESDRDWYFWNETPLGDKGCGRGPTRMTYLQAMHLNVSSMPDVWLRSAEAVAMPEEELREAVLGAFGLPPTEIEMLRAASPEITSAPVRAGTCVYVEGEDDRADARDVIEALRPTLGPTARGVPGEEQNYWITSRLIKYFAAGVEFGYEDLNFDGNPPSAKLNALTTTEKQLVLDSAAEVAARAAMIRCQASLDEERRDNAEGIIGPLPSDLSCILYSYMLNH